MDKTIISNIINFLMCEKTKIYLYDGGTTDYISGFEFY